MAAISEAAPNDPTLDQFSTGSNSSPAERCQRVALVQGSGPHLTSETASLLRMRLRAAALCLFIGAVVFLPWALFKDAPSTLLNNVLLGFHLAVIGLLALPLIGLCRRCPISLAKLRWFELEIFAPLVIFFGLLHYARLTEAADQGYLLNLGGAWFLLIFTYAMFIPNTWRRAAAYLGLMALAPNVVLWIAWLTHPQTARLLAAEPSYLVEMTLLLGITYFVGVFGTHIINHLRQEAFQAKQLGQHKLCRLLGAGGMGEVYLAEHQMMKRPCAIKVIRPNKAQDPRALARFEREVRATAKLSHWNTVEIFDYGRTDDGTFYYVMEYLPGMTLAQLIERHGPLPAARVIHLLRQTCDALSEAHAAGLIHRDIKPGNIFAAERGGVHDVVKLLDFGLVKPIAESAATHLTQDGAITGSPLYMSPEQAVGDQRPDARSDIYSLGAVAYHLLTGAPPFPGDKPIQVILAHANQEVTPPSQLRAEIPHDLEQVVLRCLAKDPSDRFQSARELSTALSECSTADQWSRDDATAWWQANGAVDQPCAQVAAAAI